jgi:hypothetical protein
MGAIRDFLDSVGRTKTGYAGTPMPGAPPVAPPDLTPTQITDALRDVLKKNIGFGGGDGTFSSTGTSKAGGAQTDAEKYAADKAAFDETLRKYQLDRRAYEQYQGDVNARLRSFNPYADAQYRIMPTNTGAPVPTPTAPAAPTKLTAPTYGAIPITMSTPTDQGAAYKQMRDFGYTDADIRSATSKITGSPTDQKWADILSAGYSQYAPAVQGAYQQLGRSGFGGGAEQIDTPGYSYWLTQLSSGALRPEDLNQAVLTAGRPSNYGEVQNIYQQYFNRTPDPSGLQTWGQSGLTGDALKNAIIGGAQGPDLAYYQQNFGGGTQQPINQVPDPYYAGGPGEGGGAARGGYISKYAKGGRVRTHYQRGGQAGEGSLEDLDAFYQNPTNRVVPVFPQSSPSSFEDIQRDWAKAYNELPRSNEIEVAVIAPEPGDVTSRQNTEAAPVSVEPPAAGRNEGFNALIARYMAPSSEYSRELADARRRSQTETEAFSNMIKQMSERGESPTSRAEMYFRLAAAFGSPTRTGSMGETLSKVGQQAAEYSKSRRADEAERRGLALKAQEIRMAGAREDLSTTRALAAQEAADRRAIAKEMIKEYIASGKASSEEGKRAEDAGYKKGTQEYNDYVRRQIESKIESGELYRQAMLAIQEGNLELRRAADARKAEAEKQLSGPELRMKLDSQNSLDASKSALRDITEALRRNENSFGMAGLDWAQYQALSRAGSNAERVQNTRIIENLLSRSAIDSLKEKFGAGITNEERKALVELEGALAKTPQERKIILERSYRELQRSIEREERRLRDISSGVYRRQTQTGNSGEGERE